MRFLFFGAHPDDVEMGCAGTILRLKAAGHWVGIVDLSHGEMGTRGNEQTRNEETIAASNLLKLDFRTNLNLGDANINNSEINRIAVAEEIRKSRPDFVFCNAPKDRHIDHGYSAALVLDACFLSGLKKYGNTKLAPHRPKNVFHYIQDYFLQPSFVIDISAVYPEKMKVILAYKTQFFQKNQADTEDLTPISSADFLDFFTGRALQMGRLINVKHGEGFIANQPLNMDLAHWFLHD